MWNSHLNAINVLLPLVTNEAVKSSVKSEQGHRDKVGGVKDRHAAVEETDTSPQENLTPYQ